MAWKRSWVQIPLAPPVLVEGVAGFDPRLLHHFERVVMRYLLALFLAVTAYASPQDSLTRPWFTPSILGILRGRFTRTSVKISFAGTGYTAKVRKVTGKMKKAIFKAYGIPKGHYGEYKVDHFISLGLQWRQHLENLWPATL